MPRRSVSSADSPIASATVPSPSTPPAGPRRPQDPVTHRLTLVAGAPRGPARAAAQTQKPGMGRRRSHPYGRPMTTLHIEHPITDYDTWAVGVRRLGRRSQGGWCDQRTCRSPGRRPALHRRGSRLRFDRAGDLVPGVPGDAGLDVHDVPPALAGRPRTAILELGPATAH